MSDLADEFGTPLYVYDEATIRHMCRDFVGSFRREYPGASVSYSSKAFTSPILARLLESEGLGMDVVTGGELAVAKAAGFPAERLNFHGNNKTRPELEEALDYGIGHITVDSFHEIGLLDDVAPKARRGPAGHAARVAQRGPAHPPAHDDGDPRFQVRLFH